MYEKEIKVILKELPDDLRREVLDYVEYLITKHGKREDDKDHFDFEWEGVLSEFKGEFTSVELQHKAMELR